MIRNKTEQNSTPRLSYISVCLLAAIVPNTSFANNNNQADIEKISIIGSNIKRTADVGALPVTTLTDIDIQNSGAMTGDDLIRSIPQMGQVNFGASTGNGGVNDARGDVSSINLRGLGTGNTLTLLNGRRLVTHPGTQSENFVPVSTVNSNTLPVAGLRSLQILRDGAAAIYGSDAVAGVVNYQLKSDFEGNRFTAKHGISEGTNLNESTINFLTGFNFNDNASHFTGSVTLYNRDGMMASERAYSQSHDLRNFSTLPEEFIGDTQLDNRTTSTPWGDFRSDSLGLFHLSPANNNACEKKVSDAVCANSGGIPRTLRFDRAAHRSLVSDVQRLNLYGHFTHEFSDNLSLFSEAIYYQAQAKREREQTHNLTAQRFVISKDAAFNPFNEEIKLNRYRPLDAGPRNIKVDDTSYRILIGLQGQYTNWDWETALFYSEAQTSDLANRVQASKFQQAINSQDTNLAYNLFSGADPSNPNTADTTLNNRAVVSSFMSDISRDSKTSLTSFDFKVSNGQLFALPDGDAGIAMGIEFRRETFDDDRDSLLDGSHPFIDQITGKQLSGSDVLGSSPTPDSSGSRNVFSAYGEVLLPLIDSAEQILELQIAARYEHFSDVGDALKPKVAVFWEPVDWISLRASYAGGFRAPGLPQITAEAVPRSNSLYDPILDDSYGISDIRSGSNDLEPEESSNISYGFVLEPTDSLTFTADTWRIKQKSLVGILPGASHLLYDGLLRSQGSQNDAVVRDPITREVIHINNTYMNLNTREIEGVDLSFVYTIDTQWGQWELLGNTAKLLKFEQVADPISTQIIAAQHAGNSAVPADRNVSGAGDLLLQNGRPKLRAKIELNWQKDQWNAGISYNYTGPITDTSTTAEVGGEVQTLPVKSFKTWNSHASYKFSEMSQLSGTKIQLGIRNLFDAQPPIADELAHGYFGSLHSNRGRYLYASISASF
ncbi:TonB-dependent receptor domain-containing protein [Pseudoalteromonas sp. MMG012]|uniref:TonB-dependent receptor domain-containing protein n=1 Tax=Pseudoalteromonas sp. MMG012 TaxID=2822686 RepID=UPI001B3A732C|nr:TonB-dependent receptor [Pseudoalteromonas sp. MMG012]MBQ4852099.1 TonB-dependent receptor [Pseudoalteromonas sp. MMG012]